MPLEYTPCHEEVFELEEKVFLRFYSTVMRCGTVNARRVNARDLCVSSVLQQRSWMMRDKTSGLFPPLTHIFSLGQMLSIRYGKKKPKPGTAAGETSEPITG